LETIKEENKEEKKIEQEFEKNRIEK